MGLLSFFSRAATFERRGPDSKRQQWWSRSAMGARRCQHLYDEHEFMQLLYLERRRSERSSRPLCLILVEGSNITDCVIRQTAFQRVLQVLRSSIRETDFIGWYEENNTLAIMFSDLKSADKAVVDSLYSKASNSVVLALTSELLKCIRVSVHVFPTGSDLGPADLTFYRNVPLRSQNHKTAHVVKRTIDIVGSLLLLCLLAPVFALIALAIKLDSKGPVVFRQMRVGQQGKLFTLLKFRSMYVNNNAAIHKEYVTKFISQGQPASDTHTIYKMTNDPRVTAVGRMLRKTSLDELLQLWNVLCGQMSLVGPRPPLPYELRCYAVWHHRRILEVKPGITGLWQVTGRSRTSFDQMVRLDLRYVQQWSIWLDFKILLQTPKAVLMGDGAY
jgi:exopolysaccharide biosynthesis polyprenyl glycosylphosphotransferase